MDYRIRDKLGEGAMGQVFRATQVSLNREVALKMMGKAAAQSEDSLQRFYRETAILCKLSHAHVVPVYDTGAIGDNPFFVMELIQGTSLAEVVHREGPLPFPRVLTLMLQLADALAYLHERGIFHRDIKPQNLVLKGLNERDHLVVVDFGLARSASTRAITLAGETVGTLTYMSPEAIEQGTEPGAPQDIWAMGHVAHLLLSGMRPFPGTNILDIAQQIFVFAPKERARLLSGIAPTWFQDMLVGCWAKDPERRLTAAKIKDLLSEKASQLSLEGYLASQPTPAVRSGEAGPVRNSRARPAVRIPEETGVTGQRRWRAALGFAVALPLLAGLAFVGFRRPDSPAPGVSVAPVSAVTGDSSGSPVASHPWSGDFPLARFLCVPSDRSVLVDADLIAPLDLVMWVTPRDETGEGRRVPLDTSRGYLHELVENLEMGKVYHLRLETAGGQVLVPRVVFRTHDANRARGREAALGQLGGMGLVDASLRYFADEPDPAVLHPLARFVGETRSAGSRITDIARLAGELRDPTLAKRLLESDHLQRYPAEILDAAARARLEGIAPKVPSAVDPMLEVPILAATSLALGREKDAATCRKLGDRLRHQPILFSVEAVEAMVACDREQAGKYFGEWLELTRQDPGKVSLLAIAAVAGMCQMGDESLLRLFAPMMGPGSDLLNQSYAATLLADHGGPVALELLREASRHPGAGASLLWSAARAGAPVPPPAGELPAIQGAASLASLAGMRLGGRPSPEVLERVRSWLASPVAWHRDLAAGMLADWEDRGAVPALRARVTGDEDAQGVAAWSVARILGPAADEATAAEIERAWKASPADPTDPGKRVLLTWAAHRVRPGTALPYFEHLVKDRHASTALKDLVKFLREDVPTMGETHHWFLPHSTYLRTGITLAAGEAIRVKGWGYYGSEKGPRWEGFARQVRNLGPGKPLGIALHQGGQEWGLAGEYRSFLATRYGEVLLSPTMRGVNRSELPLERVMPGLIRITLE